MWPLLALVALIAIVSSAAAKPKLNREQCIAKWSAHLARQADAMPPVQAAFVVALLRQFGAAEAAACLETKTTTGASCFALMRDALVADFRGILSPHMAREIARQAREQGLPGVGICFEEFAAELEASQPLTA